LGKLSIIISNVTHQKQQQQNQTIFQKLNICICSLI